MFFFSSSKKSKAAEESQQKEIPRYILPDIEDIASQREIEVQRAKWENFLSRKRANFSNTALWQRWKFLRQTGNVQKKIFSMFSPQIKAEIKLKSLIRSGVPPELRGKVWWACSGAEEKCHSATVEESYEVLRDRAVEELKGSVIANDIEKDLRRTFSERIQTPENMHMIDTLRRVLSAYALRNTSVGYCQSMNYICALLLFHMTEKETFWTMAALIEDILPPNYYASDLIGGRIDQQVFQSCIAWKMPKLYSQFKATNTILEPIICPWFLCLYINVLPPYAVCRVWDCLFWEGSVVLFRIGLSMMKSKSKMLLECNDFISVYGVLKTGESKDNSFVLEPSPSSGTLTSESSGNVRPSMDSPRGGGNRHSSLTHNSQGSSSAPGSPVGDDEGGVSSPSHTTSSSASASLGLISSALVSDTSFMINGAFGYRWLRSVPVEQVNLLRQRFGHILANPKTSKMGGESVGVINEEKPSSGFFFSGAHDHSSNGTHGNGPEKKPATRKSRKSTKNVPNSSTASTTGNASSAVEMNDVSKPTRDSRGDTESTAAGSASISSSGANQGMEGGMGPSGNENGAEDEDDDEEYDDEEDYDPNEHSDSFQTLQPGVKPAARGGSQHGGKVFTAQSRKSDLMQRILGGDTDLASLRLLALEMDEGLANVVEQFAKELEEESNQKSGGKKDAQKSANNSAKKGETSPNQKDSSQNVDDVTARAGSMGLASPSHTSMRTQTSKSMDEDMHDEDDDGVEPEFDEDDYDHDDDDDDEN